MSHEAKIVIAGAGNMAEALMKGWFQAELVLPENVYVMNRSNQTRIQYLQEAYGIQAITDVEKEIRSCDILILAIKPYDILGFLQGIRQCISSNQVIISVAAGIQTTQMEEVIQCPCSVVRVMPNTPTAVLESATAVAFGKHCTDVAKKVTSSLLSAVGSLSVLNESLMDAVTGLSGSGPAYFFYMVEAMQAAGESLGIDSETAGQLVAQTMYGAAKLLLEGKYTAAELRKQVTSPNGTTFAGLKVMQENHFQQIMLDAIKSAKARAEQMGQEVYEAHINS